MPRNKGSKEDKNNNSNGNMDSSFTPMSRGKRDRDSGSEGSPNISKKPLKNTMLSEDMLSGAAVLTDWGWDLGGGCSSYRSSCTHCF